MNKPNPKRAMAMVLVILLLTIGGYWGYRYYPKQNDSLIEATGTIEATTVNLSATIQGAIDSINVSPGDTVTKGQIVAQLSRKDLVAQKERDALTVLQASAVLADLRSGAREQEIEEAALALGTAQVNYEQSVIDVEQASKDYERIKFLYEAAAIPLVEYENANNRLENATNKLKLAENQIEAARVRLNLLESGNRAHQIEAAGVEVERSKAVLKASEAILEDLKIISPIDGEVLSQNYEIGEYVTPGAPVVSIADLSSIWIKVYIPTDELPYIKLGQSVTFTVSGIDEVFSGLVEEIASQGEFTPKTIQTKEERANIVFGVKIKVEDESGVLKPGMPADVVFEKKR